MATYHEAITVEKGVHIIHAYSVADATERAALSLVSTDVGKVVRQESDGTFWIVKSTGPNVFQEMGSDPTMGGDISGTASAAKVTALQNYNVQDHPPIDAEVLTWVTASNQWEPKAIPSGGTPAASSVTFTPDGNIAATDAQAAIVEVRDDAATALTNHTADTTAAHAASSIGFTSSGDIASTDVQAAIVEVRDDADTKLSTKVTGPGTVTDNIVPRYDSTTGYLLQDSGVAIDDTDNVSGVVNLETTGYFELADMSAPSNPSAGEGRLYKKTGDGGLFWLPDAAGPEVDLTTGGGSGDVVGPASATDNTIVRFDSTTGKLVQASSVVIDDTDNVSGVVNLETTGYVELADMTAPSNPSDAEGRLYKKTGDDGLFWLPDSGGVEVDLTSGGGGTAALTTYDDTDASMVAANVKLALDKLDGRSVVTGLITGGELTIATDPAEFDVEAGSGYVVDSLTDPANPTAELVTWTAFSDVAVTNLATTEFTVVGIDATGPSVVQVSDREFTGAEERTYIVLGRIQHKDNTSIVALVNAPHPVAQMDQGQWTIMKALGSMNISGNVFSANGVNLNIDKSSGVILRRGANFHTNPENPHEVTVAADTALTFRRYYRDGSGDFTVSAGVTAIDPGNYDDGTGTLNSVPSNRYSVQRIYLGTAGLVAVYYGQEQFTSFELARAGAENAIIEDPALSELTLRAFLVLKGDATDLSDAADAEFISAAKFTGSGGASVSGVTTHSGLDGLTADDHVRYFDKDGSKAATGNFDMDGNDITMGTGDINMEVGRLINLSHIEIPSIDDDTQPSAETHGSTNEGNLAIAVGTTGTYATIRTVMPRNIEAAWYWKGLSFKREVLNGAIAERMLFDFDYDGALNIPSGAATTPVKGDIRRNTAGDEIEIYDGTSWVSQSGGANTHAMILPFSASPDSAGWHGCPYAGWLIASTWNANFGATPSFGPDSKGIYFPRAATLQSIDVNFQCDFSSGTAIVDMGCWIGTLAEGSASNFTLSNVFDETTSHTSSSRQYYHSFSTLSDTAISADDVLFFGITTNNATAQDMQGSFHIVWSED